MRAADRLFAGGPAMGGAGFFVAAMGFSIIESTEESILFRYRHSVSSIVRLRILFSPIAAP